MQVVEGVTAGQDWFLGQWATDGLGLRAPLYMQVSLPPTFHLQSPSLVISSSA